MSDEVQVFYDALDRVERETSQAVQELIAVLESLDGEDTGVENPAHRSSLRLALHRRCDGLRDTLSASTADAVDIRRRAWKLRSGYSALDHDLRIESAP